jgi:hypothetical protein
MAQLPLPCYAPSKTNGGAGTGGKRRHWTQVQETPETSTKALKKAMTAQRPGFEGSLAGTRPGQQ